ncbi:MAG: hypothetical protein R3E87_09610 [Burkholderiaceae bacterium]
MTTPQQRFATPVIGDTYRKPVKIIALAITGVMFVAIIGAFVGSAEVGGAAVLLLLGGGAGMAMGCYHIVWGKTTIDAEGIRQDWIFPKVYRWEEIYKAKLLRLPFGTRLVLTTSRPPFKAIHGGTDELLTAFEEIAAMLPGRIGAGGR